MTDHTRQEEENRRDPAPTEPRRTGGPAPAEEPRPDAKRTGASPARPPATQRGNSLSWVHTFRVSPLALVLFLLALGGLWILFETTDLWYILFP